MSESLRLKKNAGEIYSAPTYWALASQRMRLIVSSRKFRLRGCLLVALLQDILFRENWPFFHLTKSRSEGGGDLTVSIVISDVQNFKLASSWHHGSRLNVFDKITKKILYSLPRSLRKQAEGFICWP
jgi:hypothetical protein